MKAKIYHNPRCSKSRATLALLEQHGVDTEVIDYINNPPKHSEIKELLRMLNMSAAELLRRQEAAFRESGLGPEATEAALIELMAQQPALIERPIVVVGDAARIGRPPESVLELIA